MPSLIVTGSITRKLMAVILLTSGVVLLLACATLLTYEIVTFRRSMVATLSTLARVIAANCTAALAFDNPNDATEALAALAAEPHIAGAALYDARGERFASYAAGFDADDASAPTGVTRYRFGINDLVLHEPVISGTRRLGTLYLRSDLGAMYERFTLYGATVGAVVILAAAVAIVLSARLQRHVSRPMLALAATAATVSRTRDYSLRAERFNDDELGRLTDAFNGMLAHVQAQDLSLRRQSDLLRHEIEERARAEEDVRALNRDLERRVAERTEALAAANRELESFSYSVSHDLRAPLRHVLGYVEMLQEHTAGQLSEQSQRYMGVIRKASMDMSQLIDDLLAFSRMSRIEMQEGVVPLDPMVQDTIAGLELMTRDRRIVWQTVPLPTVIGDAALLKQVFANLIGNAVKYSRMRDPAHITIGCGGREQDGRVVLFVADDGAGFDMRYAQKLFGVFQRMHRAEEFEGTGIGLATVQRIVTRHGGRVWAESAVDRGATFYFTLRPAAPPPSETPASRS